MGLNQWYVMLWFSLLLLNPDEIGLQSSLHRVIVFLNSFGPKGANIWGSWCTVVTSDKLNPAIGKYASLEHAEMLVKWYTKKQIQSLWGTAQL